MMKFSIATAAVLSVGLAGLALSDAGKDEPKEMRRIDCKKITMFTPVQGKSAEFLCRNYGGVAVHGESVSSEGLIVLVRNQPMGGSDGIIKAQ